MKNHLILNDQLTELPKEEALKIVGGGDIIHTLKCISGTLTRGAGIVWTLGLGITIWGMARMAGVIAGCSK